MNKPKNKRNAVKLALIVLAVVLLAACGTVWYMYSQVAPALDEGEAGQLNQVQDPDLASEGDRTYNLLLLGIDYDTDRDYAEGKGMTDVILYVQIDRDAGTVNAFQIPRDTYYGEDMGGGKKAIEGALRELRNVDVNVRVLQLPNAADAAGRVLLDEKGQPMKQDPDDFIKRFGPAAFEK